ncbi:MAG TPA: hypothetical protein VKM35_08945 [Arenimonas sp.]|uniref:hypothetical protein n=1 Tax=Arenimonas sp. TaxID=1872635 RepID=UPI002C4E01D8|nr:hypothetical protein [Arenimonas sp.]HMB57320.1 hypothetical protein [Arenimonas sp.]
MTSLNESLSCRIDWRRSRLFCAGLSLMIALALVSIWLSALPAWLMYLTALMSIAHGLFVLRREWQRPDGTVLIRSDDDVALLNFGAGAESWHGVTIRFRGPVGSLTGCDGNGRHRHLRWWPDTLPAASRRNLRLVADRQAQASLRAAALPG